MNAPDLRTKLEWLASWLKKVPFLSVILIAVLLQILGEAFPFSHFPMYSRLDDTTHYYFVTNSRNELVNQRMFRTRAAKMKKIFTSLKASEAEQDGLESAGERTLEYLLKQLPEDRRREVERNGLRIHRVEVRMSRAGLTRTTETLAEIPPRSAE